MIRSTIVLPGILVGVLAGCDETHGLFLPDEFVGETRDLEVYRAPSGATVCDATLGVWQAHVETVAEFLDVHGPLGPFAVILLGPGDVDRYCNTGRSGCVDGSSDPPFAGGDPWAVPHELVHLVDVTGLDTRQIPFWNEGFAEAWSDRGSELPSAPALDNLLADSFRNIDYPAASHWVQWIADAYGPEKVAAFLRVSEPEESARKRFAHFEDVLGEPYAAVQERFWAEAPLYYPGFGRCGETDHVLPARGRLDIEVTLDCAVDPGPTPSWPGGRVYTTRVLEIAESSEYRIHTDQGGALLLPCDAINDPLDAARWRSYERAIHSEGTDAVPDQLGLRAARYKLWLVSTDENPIDMHVVMEPWAPFTRYVP